MSIYAGSVLGTNENPMVALSRGQLFVPIKADKQPNVAKRILIAALVLAVAVGSILIANQLDRERTTLPDMNGVMFGKAVDQICDIPDRVSCANVYMEIRYEVRPRY